MNVPGIWTTTHIFDILRVDSYAECYPTMSIGSANWLWFLWKSTIRTYTNRTFLLVNSFVLYYTILYYTILYYTILYYTILYYTILYYTILYTSYQIRFPSSKHCFYFPFFGNDDGMYGIHSAGRSFRKDPSPGSETIVTSDGNPTDYDRYGFVWK